jgi:hypothetical protein
MKHLQIRSIFALILVACFLWVPSRAANDGTDVHGHFYPKLDATAGPDFQLIGAGRWKWKGLVPVYSSALYLTRPEDAGKIDQPVARCLSITYYREVGKADLIAAAENYLKKNATVAQITAIADRLKQINDLYRDVKEGDRYHMIFVPGQGTRLIFNGELKGTIPGDDFGPLYFSVWLGKAPVSEALRDSMLGR